jgi:hypothetical protein
MLMPSGCGIMHLNISLPARGMDVCSRSTGHPPAPPQMLTDCYKGDKMFALSVTSRVVTDPQVEEEEVGDVLPPVALC